MPVEELDAIIKAELAAKTRASDGPITGKPALWTGPFELTKPAGPSRLSPRESVAEIALGDGWGCAELDAHGERQRVCWLTSSVAERDRGKRALHAERVPWLGVWPAATADRWCARVGSELRCWSALEFIRERPAAVPEPKAWAREDNATRWSLGVAVAPGFECALDGSALVCHGSDPFAVLARSPAQSGNLAVDWPHPLALGLHHGCVREELAIECWGRGDHGELGYAPSERCQDGAGEIACSRGLGLAHVQGERGSHPPLLVAADTFTCAVTANFVECWGKSRDGFFAAPGPARVPGLRLNGVNSVSAGPRGVCGDDYDGGARCAGAIPAPPRGVSHVAVSQGDDASACGVDAEGIVCWGAAYSPRTRPRAPVRIRVDRAATSQAPVLDRPGHWDAECEINRPCSRDWANPPRCEGTLTAAPWEMLARDAAARRGQIVRVTGTLVAGPAAMTLIGCSRWGPDHPGVDPPNAPELCCNQTWAPLGLVSDGLALRLEDLACAGDESRLCCSAPATGQAIVATGRLEWDTRGDAGWMLSEPRLCSLQ